MSSNEFDCVVEELSGSDLPNKIGIENYEHGNVAHDERNQLPDQRVQRRSGSKVLPYQKHSEGNRTHKQ
jgi:hypothetical protein